jgi:ubiquinone biosynthesis protein
MIKNMLSKESAMEEAIWAGRDVVNSMRMFPRHMRWFMREWSKRNYAIETKLTGHEASFRHLSASINFLGISVIAGLLVMAGTLLVDRHNGLVTMDNIPSHTWFFWIMAGTLFVYGFMKLRKFR